MGPPGVEDDEDDDEEEEGALAAAAAATFFPAALAAGLEAGLAAELAAGAADELVLILFRRTRKHSRLDWTRLDWMIKLTECATQLEVEDEQPDTI